MTEREAPSRDFDYLPDDPYEEGGWFGHAPFVQEHKTEPIPLASELVESPTQPDPEFTDDDYYEPEQISVHPDLIEDPNQVHYEPAAEDYASPSVPPEPYVNGTPVPTDYAPAVDYADPEPTPAPPEPEPVTEVQQEAPAEPEYEPAIAYVDPQPEPEPEPAVAAAPVVAGRPSVSKDPGWTRNGQLRLTEIDPLEFKSTRQPWYNTTKGRIGILAAAVLAVVLVIVALVSRSPGADETTGPAPSTSAVPTPSSAPPATPSAVQPTLTSAPAPPPPPPPPPPAAPPPPPPAQNNAPAYTPRYQPPRRADPSPAQKPNTGVTRAPISVAPDHKATPSGPEVGKHGANDGGAGWG